MIKVLWLAQYNVLRLSPEIKLNRQAVLHSSSWIHSLSETISQSNEVELHIVTHSQLVDESQSFRKHGICFHIVKYQFPFLKRGFPWYLPIDKLSGYYTLALRIRNVINAIQPDVLHVHGTEGGYFTSASKFDIPCVISIQGIISEYVKIVPSMTGYLQVPFEKQAVRQGKYFGCRTEFDTAFVRKINQNAVIFDLPEAMNSVFFENKWKPKTEISLVFIGSINRAKGIEDLILALHKLKATFQTIQLKVIGSGTKKYFRFLTGLVKKLDLQANISWLGTKTPNEVAYELENSSFFVLPSLMDNSPNCLAEAMAVGVPSIATKVGGIPSMITDKVDGMLFDKHNVDELVNIIMSLSKDIEFQKRLSVNAKARAFNRNYPPIVAQKYIEVYKSLVN